MNIIKKISAIYGDGKAIWVEKIKLEELVAKLRMCRSDLDEETIRVEVQKIAAESLTTIKSVLHYCVMNAMEGEPMPWEEKGKIMMNKKETNKELKAVSVLKMTRKYVEQAHDDAETKHDNYGEFYMDSNLYEIMEETKRLLPEIDKIIAQFENIQPI